VGGQDAIGKKLGTTCILGFVLCGAATGSPAQQSVVARIDLPMGRATIVRVRSADGTSNRKLVFRPKGPKGREQVVPLPDAESHLNTNALWFVALQRGARPYLVADLGLGYTSGGQTTEADVFRFTAGRLRRIGTLDSNQGIRRLARPGGGELLVRSYEIGNDLGHAEMPRWEELFDVQRGRLHQLTRNVGWFYKPWAADLWNVLKTHPGDLDLWAHYGLCLQYEGLHRRPAAELRRMRRLLGRSGAVEVPDFRTWPKPKPYEQPVGEEGA
jgi:hypothetical protein